jgi:hypothetical protein
MAKVELDPAIKWIRGRLGNLVFRRDHTGKQSVMKNPDMSCVKWSPAQKAHRQKFKQAVIYAKAATADPDIRPFYERMAAERKNNKRPFDMAVGDYMDGNDLLWKKLMGDQKKPDGW